MAAICRRLDGLPLAIELAAARCALLSPSEIAARLEVALTALGSGPRDAPARQQTLRATLDWSHGLLDDDEQACFARMAVFAGGATVEAAETITGADLDTLDRLVAKSLLVRRRGRHGPTRLGMLETVRAYAGERFAALPDREAVRERHFAHYLRVARHHGIQSVLDGPDTREHLACLDDELENFRAALRFAAERDAAERVLELSTALVDYWQRRDRSDEAVHWVLPALRKTAATADPALRARALGKVFWPLWDSKRRDELPALVAEAETLASDGPRPRLPGGGALQLRRDPSLHRPVRRGEADRRRGAQDRAGLRRRVDDRDGRLGASASRRAAPRSGARASTRQRRCWPAWATHTT